MKTIIILAFLPCLLMAQSEPVLTTFPSLTIAASSRGWGMGNTGIGASLENQALSYNVAASAFTQHLHQAGMHYMPWLPGISNDARYVHVDYLGSLNNSAMGLSVGYLNLGTIAIRDVNGATLGLFRTSEYHVGGSYAIQISNRAALGTTLRFFGQTLPAGSFQNTYSVSGDVSYYQSCNLGDASNQLSWGAVVSNLGANINLPSTAGVGIAYTNIPGNGDRFVVSVDANRLLRDSWKGMRLSAGAEYGFAEQFFLRGGISLENPEKGSRKFFSLGAGYKGFVSDQSWGLDCYWLVPFGVSGSSPFQNSYGLTLFLNIGNFQ